MTASRVIRLAGGVVRDNDGRVLALHRRTPTIAQWEVPGGKVEAGEREADTACRELLEELGIVVRPVGELGRCEFIQAGTAFAYSWFAVEVLSGEPQVLEPATFDAAAYFDVRELLRLSDASPSLARLASVLAEHSVEHAMRPYAATSPKAM